MLDIIGDAGSPEALNPETWTLVPELETLNPKAHILSKTLKPKPILCKMPAAAARALNEVSDLASSAQRCTELSVGFGSLVGG